MCRWQRYIRNTCYFHMPNPLIMGPQRLPFANQRSRIQAPDEPLLGYTAYWLPTFRTVFVYRPTGQMPFRFAIGLPMTLMYQKDVNACNHMKMP